MIGRSTIAVIFLGTWIWQTRPGHISPLIIPSPESVVRELPHLLTDAVFWASLRTTALEVLGALAIAVGIGLTLGGALASSRYVAQVAGPIFTWIQTIPVILFYPLCLLYFGVGATSKIVFAGVYGLLPILAGTVAALSSVPKKYGVAALSMGASRSDRVFKVLLPAARPMVVGAVRIGAALCLIGVIAGEILGSIGGLGYQITSQGAIFEIPTMYAYIVVTLVLVIAVNLVVGRADEPQF
jgi:ABC-type nitrate/sulfonate/bicarbonate transport system permease component